MSLQESHGMMNRLLDLQIAGFADLDWQIQDIANETPLRGDYPRFRRTELLDGTKSVSPRKDVSRLLLRCVGLFWDFQGHCVHSVSRHMPHRNPKAASTNLFRKLTRLTSINNLTFKPRHSDVPDWWQVFIYFIEIKNV